MEHVHGKPLEGFRPTFWGTVVLVLLVSGIPLTCSFSIEEVRRHIEGTTLNIYGDQVSGPIPSGLSMFTNLTEIYIHDNALSGPIPVELAGLTNLSKLYLFNNSLTGPIPKELGHLASLTHLVLFNNSLSGPIPTELGGLAKLTNLLLQNNSLLGSIPSELGRLGNLVELSLHNNVLSGPIPQELGNLSNLNLLYLHNNNLSSPISPKLGGLVSIVELYLNNNSLSGPIPPELAKLTKLTELALSDNVLTGGIPQELGNLKGLTYLSLFNNNLSGPIPSGLLKFGETVLPGNPGLCPSNCRDPPANPPTQSVPPPAANNLPPGPGVVSTATPSSQLVPPPAVYNLPPGPGIATPASPPPPNSVQVDPTPPKNLAKLLGLALALPTGLLSAVLTVAFFVVEVRKHRKVKQAIVRNAIKLCRTGARHKTSSGQVDDTPPLRRPQGMADEDFDAVLAALLHLVLERLEAWPKRLGLRGDPHEAIWAHNFRRFEHYVLFRAFVDADFRYQSRFAKGLLETWNTSRHNPEDRSAIVDSIYVYLGGILHDKWTGQVEELGARSQV